MLRINHTYRLADGFFGTSYRKSEFVFGYRFFQEEGRWLKEHIRLKMLDETTLQVIDCDDTNTPMTLTEPTDAEFEEFRSAQFAKDSAKQADKETAGRKLHLKRRP